MANDVSPRPKRSLWGRLGWLLDGSRRLVLNLLFLAIVLGLLLAWLKSGPPRLKDKTVLVLDLAGPLVEQRSGSPRDQALQQLQGQPGGQVQLRDLVTVLDAAASDEHISSVLLVLDDFQGAGLPSLREAMAAIARFKQASGKKVLAWGQHYDQRQYLLASAADELLLHPMGLVRIEGYGRLRSYYRDAFDRLGVSANVIRVGKYKNFGEPYFANGPSPATLEADATLYDALWASYSGMVETARKLPAGGLGQLINELTQRLEAAGGDLARLALDGKLVDGLKTRDQLRDLLIQRGARDDEAKTFRQIGFADYLARQTPKSSGGDAIGVVVAQGEIVDGTAGPGTVGGQSTADLIRKARDDDKIKAIVLRVNSPGGSAFASELIRRELELARAAGKPVVVSMGDVAASGGYWISMAADAVIADPSTLTGSIGVFAMLPTAEGLMAKLSVNTAGYSTTWLTNVYDPRRPLDPRFGALVQLAIGHIYADFTGKAAAARKTSVDKIDAVAQGRVWTGEQALARGLVDRTGSFGDALATATQLAKLDKDRRVAYIEREPSPLNRVMGLLGVQADLAGLVGAAFAPLAPLARQAAGPSAALANAVLPGWQQEVGWLADLINRREPFSAVVHCLCTPL
jgi:protease-4